MSVAATGGRAPARLRVLPSDRALAAVPILTVFFWLALLYCWESWGHITPWLFTDELETAQLSRAIAETGHAARRSQPHSFQSLFNYLIAPAWWFDDTNKAYAAIKYIGSVTMASVVFPTYWLARTVVSKPWALFAAAGAATIPALVYSSFLVEEPLAYPYAALCFFLIAKALTARTRWWILGAVAASLVAPAVRGQLAVIPGVLILAALFRWWGSERMTARRREWTRGDWLGAITLIVGALVFVNAFISHHSYAWLISTLFYKDRMLDYGLWAGGALTIGLGVFPAVAGLASLFPPRGLGRSDEERAYRCVAFAGIGLIGFYTAVKAAYISTVFSTLVEERNLIYVAPLLFVGTALVLERGRVRWTAVLSAAALVLYLVKSTPYKMEFHFYFDAPGLGILQAANQKFHWTPEYAQNVLLGMLAVSVVLLMLLRAVRWLGPNAVTAVAGTVAVAVLAWNLTAQITAGISSKYFSELYSSNIQKPLDWLDRETGGAPTVYLGQNVTDPTGIQELEFWNRSINWMWSLDGTAAKVGAPTLSPDFAKTTGRMLPEPKEAKYLVADEGLDIVGKVVKKHVHLVGGGRKNWVLWRIAPPLRLAQATTGLYDDGWSTGSVAYSRFATPGSRAGYAQVTISRLPWGGTNVPGHVVIKAGKLVVGSDKQPRLGAVTDRQTWTVNAHGYKVFYLRVPKPPFRVSVKIDPTFSPLDLQEGTDNRQLGAQMSFGYVAKVPGA